MGWDEENELEGEAFEQIEGQKQLDYEEWKRLYVDDRVEVEIPNQPEPSAPVIPAAQNGAVQTLTAGANGGIIYPEDVTGQELKDMIKRSNSLEKPIFAIDTPDNCFASRAALIKPEYGKYDVALHGIPTAAFFFEKEINARTLAIIIRNRPDYKAGTPVRLLSCNTGNTTETGNCFAQLLANELRTTVYAPTKKLYVNPDGTIFVGKKKDGFFKDFIWRE